MQTYDFFFTFNEFVITFLLQSRCLPKAILYYVNMFLCLMSRYLFMTSAVSLSGEVSNVSTP